MQFYIIPQCLHHLDEGIINHALILLDHAVHIGLGGINLFRQLRLRLSLLYALYLNIYFYIIYLFLLIGFHIIRHKPFPPS